MQMGGQMAERSSVPSSPRLSAHPFPPVHLHAVGDQVSAVDNHHMATEASMMFFPEASAAITANNGDHLAYFSPPRYCNAKYLVKEPFPSWTRPPPATPELDEASKFRNGDQITGKRARGAEADECQTSVPGKLRCTCS